MAEALGTEHMRGRELLRGWQWPVRATLVLTRPKHRSWKLWITLCIHAHANTRPGSAHQPRHETQQEVTMLGWGHPELARVLGSMRLVARGPWPSVSSRTLSISVIPHYWLLMKLSAVCVCTRGKNSQTVFILWLTLKNKAIPITGRGGL
jgi:hypothetical protein